MIRFSLLWTLDINYFHYNDQIVQNKRKHDMIANWSDSENNKMEADKQNMPGIKR